MAAKDFGLIEEDYAFFMAHTTEAHSDVAEYTRELAKFAENRASIHWLDFGCGAGGFTRQLAANLNWPPEALQMTLVEPVRHQREDAVRRMAAFSHHAIESLESLPSAPGLRFDVILSNHALYYVDDLGLTLRQMNNLLGPGGILLLAIAGWDNPLLQLWKVGFAMLGRPVPYYSAQDVEAVLSQQLPRFRQSAAPYQLRFPDTVENRLKVLRFLFGEYLQEISAPRLLGELDPYRQDGHIEVNTFSHHFAVESSQAPADF